MLSAMHILAEMELCSINQFPRLEELMLHLWSNRLPAFHYGLDEWRLTLIPFSYSSIQQWFIKFWLTQMLRQDEWTETDLTSAWGRMSSWLSWVFFWHVECYVLRMSHWMPSGPESMAMTYFNIQWQGIASVASLCTIFSLTTRPLEQQGDRQTTSVWWGRCGISSSSTAVLPTIPLPCFFFNFYKMQKHSE